MNNKLNRFILNTKMRFQSYPVKKNLRFRPKFTKKRFKEESEDIL
jgi:hypothetical protein